MKSRRRAAGRVETEFYSAAALGRSRKVTFTGPGGGVGCFVVDEGWGDLAGSFISSKDLCVVYEIRGLIELVQKGRLCFFGGSAAVGESSDHAFPFSRL